MSDRIPLLSPPLRSPLILRTLPFPPPSSGIIRKFPRDQTPFFHTSFRVVSLAMLPRQDNPTEALLWSRRLTIDAPRHPSINPTIPPSEQRSGKPSHHLPPCHLQLPWTHPFGASRAASLPLATGFSPQ